MDKDKVAEAFAEYRDMAEALAEDYEHLGKLYDQAEKDDSFGEADEYSRDQKELVEQTLAAAEELLSLLGYGANLHGDGDD